MSGISRQEAHEYFTSILSESNPGHKIQIILKSGLLKRKYPYSHTEHVSGDSQCSQLSEHIY